MVGFFLVSNFDNNATSLNQLNDIRKKSYSIIPDLNHNTRYKVIQTMSYQKLCLINVGFWFNVRILTKRLSKANISVCHQ